MGGILGKLSPLYDLATGGQGGALNSALGFLGPIGKILGAVNTAQSLFGGKEKEKQQAPVRAAQATPFSPSRPEEAQRPESLGGEFASFTPEQQRSALATKGVNTGLGSDENAYYRNLIQRSLIGEGNQVDSSNPNFLMPVESQYFSQQGFNTSDIMKFLQGISG